MLILGTGSRLVPPNKAHIIWNTLAQLDRQNLMQDVAYSVPKLMHGECPLGGADLIMASWANGAGWDVEAFPPDPEIYGTTSNRRFYLRNQAMVDRNPDQTVAFLMTDEENRGTQMTIDLSRKAKIPILEVWI